MTTTVSGTDPDDDGFDVNDDRYDSLILPPEVQQLIDQVSLNVTFLVILIMKMNFRLSIEKWRRHSLTDDLCFLLTFFFSLDSSK